jgi:hypothetical protein
MEPSRADNNSSSTIVLITLACWIVTSSLHVEPNIIKSACRVAMLPIDHSRHIGSEAST